VLSGSYMGYTVCEWYKEQVSRYHIVRQTNMVSVQWIFPNQLKPLFKSQCHKKIDDSKMD